MHVPIYGWICLSLQPDEQEKCKYVVILHNGLLASTRSPVSELPLGCTIQSLLADCVNGFCMSQCIIKGCTNTYNKGAMQTSVRST